VIHPPAPEKDIILKSLKASVNTGTVHLEQLQPERFAIVQINGLQYKILEGDVIVTHRLIGCDVGEEILLQKVLMVGSKNWTGNYTRNLC
jgi:hypothetical protein